MSALLLFLAGALVCILAVHRWWKNPYRRMPKGARKLPGPWSLPLIGRAHGIPAERTWLHFYKWSKEFGPIYKHDLFGTTHVWISSDEIAKDVLAGRDSVCSDRPVINNLPYNKTGGEYLVLLGENDIWRRQRKFGTHLMAGGAQNDQFQYPVMETKRLLFNLLYSPALYRNFLQDQSARNICRLAWGSPQCAPTLQRVTMALLKVISPFGALPNVISPLAALPKVMSPWKQYEKRRYKEEQDFFLSQMESVRAQWLAGTAKPSYMRMVFEAQENSKIDDLEGAYQVGMMAIVGALTVASPMMSFVLAMVLFPTWLKNLQDEIDTVCGDRLPEMRDMANLPILRAVVKEVLRWRPPIPTGIPHASTEDFVYKGYFIPAGSTIHAMEWGIAREPSVYPDGDSFLPDRWVSPEYPTYREPLTTYPRLEGHSQFGYGPRTCMGVDIVSHELLLVCGALAWAFNFKTMIGEDGKEIVVEDLKYSSLLITLPDWFPFEMKVRSEKKRMIIDMWGEDVKREVEEEKPATRTT